MMLVKADTNAHTIYLNHTQNYIVNWMLYIIFNFSCVFLPWVMWTQPDNSQPMGNYFDREVV